VLIKGRVKGKYFSEIEVGDIICLSFGDDRSRDIPFQLVAGAKDTFRLERWKS
jgi:hypothetical protein